MSKTVDERVVSMQFDNRNFEQNAKTSMSTLDKLKQKLNLSGAAKGLDEVNAASKKVNFKEMENAAYRSGFHVQDIWLKTASVFEYQVARKIVNAALNMFNQLMVAPVSDGFKEYEMVLNAVQTTMAGTGKTAEEVEKELQKLDEYADKTVYSTSDMLNNLPKFTNAGVALEDATKAMIGIANATALAGGDAGKASIAFYNLGQAIGTGYLTRMDYNSINNAGIATMQWKEAMVEAAIAQGTLTKVGEDAYKAGNKTLTLNQLFIDGLQEQWATTDVMMKVFGDYGDETTAIGEKAYAAAQDIKTFTMMMDSLKATAGTGWKETWQIIFGGLEDAKKFWTGLNNFISNIITTLNDWRNTFLATALQSPFKKISDGMKELGRTADKVAEKVTKPMKDLSEIVERTRNGEFGNTEARWAKLTEMGYDWIKVQNLVNEAEGCSFRRKEETNEVLDDSTEATEELTDATVELNDAVLKEIGLTEDEIEVYKKLQEISKRTGIPIEEINGRMLLIESFKNIGQSLVGVFRQLKNAWTDTFSPLRPVVLLNIIDKFNQFTESIMVNHEKSYKLYRTFRGLFAIIDIVATITGGAFRIAFEIVKELLSYFNLDILDLTAAIGDVISRFRNWLKSLINVKGIVQVIAPLIERAVNAVRRWANSIKESKAFQTFVDRIRSVTTAVREWFAGMKDAENLPQYIANGIGTAIGYILKFARDLLKNLIKFITGGFRDIPGYMADGFVGGLGAGIKKVGQGMVEFARTIIDRVKEILDIHSPSKVFFAIGGFVVAGFILGFRDKIGEVFPALGEFADTVVNFIKGINFGKLFATAGSIAMLSFAKSMMDVAGGLKEVLEGVGATLISFAYTTKQFGTAIKRLSKGIKNSLNAMAFKQFAISIAILVGAIVVLALIASKEGMVAKLWIAVGIVAALAAIMVGLMAAITALNTPKGKVDSKTVIVNMAGITTAILAIASSMLIMAFAAKMLGDMDDAAFKRASKGIIGLAVIMVGLMAATKLLAKSTSSAQTLAGSTKTTVDIAAIGATLIQIAASLLVLVIAAKMIASMSWEDMAKASAGLIFLGGIMVGLMAATKLLAKTKAGSINAGLMSAGKMLLSMAAAMIILVIAAKMIADMSWEDMAKAGAGLVVLAGLLVGLVAATQLITKTAKGGLSTQIAKIGTMLLSIAAAILILSIAAKIIAGMSWDDMGKAAVGITALAGVMVGLVAATKVAGGSDLKGVAVTLIAMAGAIALMTFSVLILSLLDLGSLMKGVIAVGLLGAIVIGMVKATEKAHSVKGTMIGMAVAIAIMAAAIAILSFIDPADLIAPTLAMAALMGMFSLMEKMAGKTKQAMKTVYALAAVVAVMALALGLLSLLPVQNVLASAVALSLLMGVLAVAMMQMNKIRADNDTWIKIGMLAAIAASLFILVGVLALMSGVQNAITNAIALSILAAVLTALLIPLSAIGKTPFKDVALGIAAFALISASLLILVGVLALMSGVQNAMTNAMALAALAIVLTVLLIPLMIIGSTMTTGIGAAGVFLGIAALATVFATLFILVGVLAAMSAIPNASANAVLLIALMTTLTDTLVKISLVAPLAVIAVVAINALIGVIIAIGALAIAIGALMTEFPQKGLPILEQIAGSIGTMIGKFVAGLASEVAGVLPYLGLCLGQFMTNAMPFIAGAKLVDESVLIGVGILAGSILALTAASVIEGIASFLTGGSSFADLGTQLSLFMLNAMPFIEAAKQIDPSIIENVGALATVILTLTAANLLESLTTWITGGSSLSKFGEELASFGPSLRAFADAVTGINPEAVRAAADAGKALAEMANMIPNQGGIVSWFAGDNSLGSFGPQIAFFGRYLKMFADNVAGIDPASVTSAAQAGKTLAEMASTIPNQGGVASWFAGDNSLGSFAPQIASFGFYLKKFADNVAGIDPASVTAAAQAGKTIAEMANMIPNQGGVASWFAGDNSLGAFAPQIASFGRYLKMFADNVAGIDPASVTAAAQAGKDLAKMASTVPNQGGIKAWFTGDNSLAKFGGKIASFGKHLKSFSDNVAGVNPTNIAAASEAGKNLAQMASEVPKDVNIGTFGLQLVSFGKSMESFAKQVSGIKIDGLNTTVIEFKAMMKKIADIGREGANGLVDAFKDAKSNMVTAATELGRAALKGVDSANLRNKFSTIGKQCAEGFAAGITANTFMPQARAVAMAQAALNAAKSVLRINSPSKAFRDMGMSVPEGFAMGIDKLGGMVKNSAIEMADGAIDGTKTAIARIADAINSDIETQPTIRPVLDLSDVRSGANSLSGMLAMTPSVGVMANVGAISSMMNNRQNGGNDDVVSALNDLKSSLSGRTGDSYTINGITYDDGTNVSTAVKELVRAARIERRI